MGGSEVTREVVATGFGGPEVLSVIDMPVGSPGAEEVRIEVRAAGTNPVDYKMFNGAYGRDRAALPMRIGREAAGVVAAVGERAAGPTGAIQVGEEVVAFPIVGAYAGAVVVPASSVVPKPSTLSFEEASGLMLTGATALHGLKRRRLARATRS